ncbi:hypothetical protein AMTR_s00088p00059310 [Amborella trichopoda]|uniref:NB-ARC domain-containing protein n=1 Tax=Amborella trichopoda TaxID=13333 RepID=W1NXV1_AMBTC|nr:hypothetical protein AMTR_s00088p00059310 [Amborella trichopoda]
MDLIWEHCRIVDDSIEVADIIGFEEDVKELQDLSSNLRGHGCRTITNIPEVEVLDDVWNLVKAFTLSNRSGSGRIILTTRLGDIPAEVDAKCHAHMLQSLDYPQAWRKHLGEIKSQKNLKKLRKNF